MSARALRGLTVWMTALWVALTLLRRMWRGEVVVLSQYGAPVVRLLAIALVFLASCVEKVRTVVAQPQELAQDLSQESGEKPAPPEVVVAVDQEFPESLDDAGLQRLYNWIEPRTLHRYFESAVGEATSEGSVGAAQPLPPQRDMVEARQLGEAHFLRGAIEVHLGGRVAVTDLLRLLDAAEAAGLYDEWFAGHLWRHARTLRPAPVALLARIERHLRIVHALVLGQASTGPLEFSAWRSKAGPPPGWTKLRVPAGLVAAAREAFKQGADAGTWEAEAVLELTVARGEPVLVRRAAETKLTAGAPLRLRRLDVVRAPAAVVLRHATLGELQLPAGAELTAWNVARFLDAAGRAWVQGRLRAALDGESAALTELEAVLPAAQEAIRAAVVEAEARDAGGRAAALRMLLQAYDE